MDRIGHASSQASFLSLSYLYLLYLFIHSLPQRHCYPHLPLPFFLSLPAVPLLRLMNDLAGGGSGGCGEPVRLREVRRHFLPPPSYYSHSVGYTATQPCQEKEWHRLIGLSVTSWSSRSSKTNWVLSQICFCSVSAHASRRGDRCSN